MTQPLLLEVPKDSPSHKERLDAFKLKVGIWTNLSGKAKDSCADFYAWMALILPADCNGKERYSDHRAYCNGSDDPFEMFAGYCRILEETRRIGYGHTEREVVEMLCEGLGIHFDLFAAPERTPTGEHAASENETAAITAADAARI